MPYRYPLKFGKYLFTRRISVGGMAEVFKAKLVGIKGFEKTLAVKRILPEFNEDEEFVQMFVDEARISSNLHHANIVQVYDFGVVEGAYYIAMEYVDGPNLKNLVQRTLKHTVSFPRNLALYVLLQIARGLEYAHTVRIEGETLLNLVHRDVSPQNILISRNGEVKITDFGIAKATIKLSRTQPGKIQGKFSYMSPEQAQGKPLDRRSDIFSLGIIAFEILSGVKLYGSDDTQRRYKEVRDAKIPRLGEVVPDLSAQVESLIMRILSKDPDDRPQSAAAVATELSEILGNISANELSTALGQLVDEIFPQEKSEEEPPRAVSIRAEPDGAPAPSTTEETTIVGGRWFLSFHALARLTILALAITGAAFFLYSYRGRISTAERLPASQPSPRASPLAAVVIDPRATPFSGPVDADIRAEAKAREDAAARRLREVENQLEETSREAAESARRLAQAQKELRQTKVETHTSPCPGDMILIASGNFQYGSDPADPDRQELLETELRSIPMQRFCVDRYEYPNRKGDLPIHSVAWSTAHSQCASGGKRLCSQEEWERACKGPTSQRYPYGNQPETAACNTEPESITISSVRILPSGSRPRCRSPEGVVDLSGNLDEWTASRGRYKEERRVVRGGSYRRPTRSGRCASFGELQEMTRAPDVGFRCCKDAF